MQMENVLAFPRMTASHESINYVVTFSTGSCGKKYSVIGLRFGDREEIERIAALLENAALDLRGPIYR